MSQAKVRRPAGQNGGDELEIASGGVLEVDGVKYTAGTDRLPKVAVVALAGGAANAFAFAWQNPESSAILVKRVLLDITTAGGTATSVLDIGSAANATTGSDNLIDGVDANSAALRDNITDNGTNGKSRQRLDAKAGATDHITGQILTAAASNLAGNVYIEYVVV